MCDREESRPLEKVSRCVLGYFDSNAKKLSISTESLARVMIKNSLKKIESASETLENNDIAALDK